MNAAWQARWLQCIATFIVGSILPETFWNILEHISIIETTLPDDKCSRPSPVSVICEAYIGSRYIDKETNSSILNQWLFFAKKQVKLRDNSRRKTLIDHVLYFSLQKIVQVPFYTNQVSSLCPVVSCMVWTIIAQITIDAYSMTVIMMMSWFVQVYSNTQWWLLSTG